MDKFKLEIITPEKIVYEDMVEFLSAPGVAGTLGILPNHAPIFAKLAQGELKIRKDKDDIYMAIGGGFLEITRNLVQVLVTRAINAEKLNEQEILKARQTAETALKAKPNADDLQAAQILLRQSLVDMQILRRRKRKSQ